MTALAAALAASQAASAADISTLTAALIASESAAVAKDCRLRAELSSLLSTIAAHDDAHTRAEQQWDRETAELQSRVEDLRFKHKMLRKFHATGRRQQKGLKDSLASVNRQLAQSKRQLAQTKRQQARARRQQAAFQSQQKGALKGLLDRAESVQAALGTKSQEVVQLQAQVSQLKSGLDSGLSAQAELMNYRHEEVGELKAKVALHAQAQAAAAATAAEAAAAEVASTNKSVRLTRETLLQVCSLTLCL